jgi:hypothetical protein
MAVLDASEIISDLRWLRLRIEALSLLWVKFNLIR